MSTAVLPIQEWHPVEPSSQWSRITVEQLLNQPFNELVFQAHTVHRQHFDPNEVQISTLLSIKTGACPEDCAYCPQSVHHATELEPERLLDVDEVLEQARAAKQNGSSRFCMGAAWREPTGKNLERVAKLIEAVKAEGMETCVTLGMLNQAQAARLKSAGLDYYNHNLDTSRSFYGQIISTRQYQDRLDTLMHVRDAGINVCSGGIIGMGETVTDRADLLCQLANLPEPPESVPINLLVQVEGTPLFGLDELDPLQFVRMIAAARIMMPTSYVRLSAGRNDMDESTQALCFFAGANSIFYGEKLLTTDNPAAQKDQQLFKKLGLHAKALA